MLYKIANKYYIRVAPMRYTEVEFVIENDDVIIKPTKNKLLANANISIDEINFQKEKENIKKKLNNNSDVKDTTVRTSRNRRRG